MDRLKIALVGAGRRGSGVHLPVDPTVWYLTHE